MNQTAVSSDGVRFFHESLEAEKRGDIQQTYQLLLSAVTEDPTIVGAWNNLGVVFHKWKRWAPAAAAFSRACKLAPQAIQPLMNHAWNLHLCGRSTEALPLIKRVTERPEADSLSWTNRSQIHLALDQVPLAIEAARKALQLAKPGEPMPQLALALALLRTGNYEEGLLHYEARFPYALPHVLQYPYPLWRGEDISEKRIFIVGEQGIGDSVQFMRFLPAVAARARQVIVHVHGPVLGLYRLNLPDNVEIQPIPREMPGADVFCPMVSLPVALHLTNADIKNSYYEYKLGDQPSKHVFPKDGIRRVGICWAGDPNHDNDKWRSGCLTDFLPLAEMNNVQLYSLQMGERRKDTDTIGTHGIVRDLSPYISDVLDTAKIIKEMDAVVTVDTSVAHIAGSVGTRTFLLIPRRGLDWRWEDGEGKTIWYPNTTMIRQKQVDGWGYVIDRVRSILD